MKHIPIICMSIIIGVFTIYSCKKPSTSTATTTTSTWTCNSHLLYTDSSFFLTFPTAFTPNGDGINDVYLPIDVNMAATGYLLTIYKPNGHIIFQTTDPHKAWTGTDSSGKLSTDYKFGVKVNFTNAHGTVIDTCTTLYLLPSSGTGCVTRVYADTANYIFSDQLARTTGQKTYNTFESFCN